MNSGWRSARRVLVAEAAGDLEVALDARHHQQLLQLLRALRQGVEFARVQAAGHDKVARAFGRALEQDRRLDLQEVARRQVLADKAHDAVAQHQVLRHAGAADVEIAVLEPQHLVHLVAGRADVERRGLGRVEDRHLVGDHLDVTRGQVGVAQPFGSCRHRALHLDHKFRPRLRGDVMRLFLVGVDRHLGNAKAVAQVDKDQPAVVAPAVDPACQGHTLAHIGQVQFATSMRFEHKCILANSGWPADESPREIDKRKGASKRAPTAIGNLQWIVARGHGYGQFRWVVLS